MRAIFRRRLSGGIAPNVTAAGCLFAPAREHFANPLELLGRSRTYSRRQSMKDGDSAGLCKDIMDIGVRHTGNCTGLKMCQ